MHGSCTQGFALLREGGGTGHAFPGCSRRKSSARRARGAHTAPLAPGAPSAESPLVSRGRLCAAFHAIWSRPRPRHPPNRRESWAATESDDVWRSLQNSAWGFGGGDRARATSHRRHDPFVRCWPRGRGGRLVGVGGGAEMPQPASHMWGDRGSGMRTGCHSGTHFANSLRSHFRCAFLLNFVVPAADATAPLPPTRSSAANPCATLRL